MTDYFEEKSPNPTRHKRQQLTEHELNDLREYIDGISFNLGKAYHHAKDRSRKQSARSSMRRLFQHSHKKSQDSHP